MRVREVMLQAILHLSALSDVTHAHRVQDEYRKELMVNYGPSDYRVTTVQTQPQFRFTEPVPAPLRLLSVDPATEVRNFDIMPDGQRFMGLTAGTSDIPGSSTPQIQVVLNWLEELKQRVPVK